MIQVGLSRKFIVLFPPFCLLLLLNITATSQIPTPLIEASGIELSDAITERTLIYIDSFQTVDPAKLATLNNFSSFPKDLKSKVDARQVEHTVYLKCHLKNSIDSPIVLYFYPGQYFDSIVIYKLNSDYDTLELIPEIGAPGIAESAAYRKITLKQKEESSFFIKLRFIKTSTNKIDLYLIRDYFLPSFAKNLRTPSYNLHIATYIIVGILIMMVIYSLAVFILNGTVEFLYYVLFSAFMALLFFLKLYLYGRSFPFNHFYEGYLDFIILCIATFFYLVFIQKFINAKSNFPFLFKLFRVVEILTVAGAGLFSIFYFMNFSFLWPNAIENYLKYIWTGCTIAFIFYAATQKNKLLTYLAIGHFLYLVAIIFALLLIENPTIFKMKEPSIWGDPLFYTQLGLTLELICFLLALAFKNRTNLIERTRERERLKMDNERKEFEKQLAVVQAKQEERNRISTDMHDELGSGVTAIRLMSEIMRTKMKEKTLPEVDKISNSANELHSKMNTIIWTMSSSNDRLDNLVAYIRSHAFEFLENTNIDCHFKNPEHIPAIEISGEKRRNIYLCIKETLNNMMKYSKATELWIEVNIILSKLEITVQDNGVGINKEKLREFGNGLANMQKRMESIGGTFSIENKNGTQSVFTVPL
jgi:signal transduction histidine kinase